MLGVGGSALVAKTLGENDIPRARRYFTMMMYLMLGTSVFFTILGIVILRLVAYLFGATEAMMSDVMTYGTICLVFNTALQAQYTFQSYLVTAEKPKMALGVVIAAGVTNMVLGYVFMAFFPYGRDRRGSGNRAESVRRGDHSFRLVPEQAESVRTAVHKNEV